MKRTVSIKLSTTPEQNAALEAMQKEFSVACNQIVQIVATSIYANRVALHHLSYYAVRELLPV